MSIWCTEAIMSIREVRNDFSFSGITGELFHSNVIGKVV